MIYIQDKHTQKPRWTNSALTRLQNVQSYIESQPGFANEADMQRLQNMMKEERPLVVSTLASYMPESVKQELKQRMFKKQLAQLKGRRDSAYNNSDEFKRVVHLILEFTCNRNGPLSDKVHFACKSHDTNVLPGLDGDTMNSGGTAHIKDVVEYLCNEDGLF